MQVCVFMNVKPILFLIQEHSRPLLPIKLSAPYRATLCGAGVAKAPCFHVPPPVFIFAFADRKSSRSVYTHSDK